MSTDVHVRIPHEFDVAAICAATRGQFLLNTTAFPVSVAFLAGVFCTIVLLPGASEDWRPAACFGAITFALFLIVGTIVAMLYIAKRAEQLIPARGLVFSIPLEDENEQRELLMTLDELDVLRRRAIHYGRGPSAYAFYRRIVEGIRDGKDTESEVNGLKALAYK